MRSPAKARGSGVALRHLQTEHARPSSLRRTLARTRTRWILTTLISISALWWTVSTVNAADANAAAWGHRRTVPIARHDLEPGQILTEADVSFVERPSAFVPADVATTPVGRTVTRTIARDEVVLERRLARGDATGPSAQLNEHSVAFAVPADASTPSTKIGDHVTLFAPSELVAAGRTSGPATRIAEDALVVVVTEKAVTVGVDLADAPSVAKALLSSSVIIALTN